MYFVNPKVTSNVKKMVLNDCKRINDTKIVFANGYPSENLKILKINE